MTTTPSTIPTTAIHLDQARTLLKGKAERLTGSRLSVLAALLAAQSAMAHTEVLKAVEQINPAHVDRVTIYRVLEWLTEVGLAHRVAGTDRVFRFSAHASNDAHGHFHCSDCGRMFCVGAQEAQDMRLEHASKAPHTAPATALNASVQAMLPKGFVSGAIDLTISGQCAHCAVQPSM